LQDGTLYGSSREVFGCGFMIARRLTGGSYQAPQAFPPHVGLLPLQSILLEEHKLHSGEPIPVGTLRLPGLARWGLRGPLALGVESIWVNGVHGDEILYHHLRPTARELLILLLIAGTSMTSHRHAIPRVVIDQQ